MTQLCNDFNISRPTGYNIVQNYERYGMEVFNGRSRRPNHHPNQTPKKIEDSIIDLRKTYPRWGGKKIRKLLLDEWDESCVPSVTTVNNILKKHGLVPPRKMKRSRIVKRNPIYEANAPLHFMTADFKGKFRLGNKKYCYPLTIADPYSRMIFAIDAFDREATELIIPSFTKVFKEYGVPEFVHTDNGTPFGMASALHRLTRFSAWLIEQGTTPVYSDPGEPTQNGKHERMHRELKGDACRPPEYNMKKQQVRFDHFRKVFNEIRPHEGIGMKRPIELHKNLGRPFMENVTDWCYDKSMLSKLVMNNGTVRWGKKGLAFVSTALIGKFVGFLPIGDGFYELYYRHVLLGFFSEVTFEVYDVDSFK